MAKRKRDIQLKFRVTPQEREMIETKMAQFGTTNMAAYLRKMAIDGYVVKLDLPELRELVSLLRYSSHNLNQFTPPPPFAQKQKPRRKTASELLRFQIIFIEQRARRKSCSGRFPIPDKARG